MTSTDSRISAAIICLDEERDLPACLASLQWVKEIVVVIDTKTRDRTAEIAEAGGAKIYHRAWSGWTDQKNYAFGLCSGDWIMSIDADERVPNELRDEINARIAGDSELVGYYVPRKNLWLGRWMRHGGWYPDYTLRLFRRGQGTCRYKVHERIEVSGATGTLSNPLIHDNIQTINEHLVTMLHATEAEAEEMVANNVRFYWLPPLTPVWRYFKDLRKEPVTSLRAYLLAKQHFKNRVEFAWAVPLMPGFKFVQMYVLNAGFRDGLHGFWLAVLSGVYVVVKYAKYWAIRSGYGARRVDLREPDSLRPASKDVPQSDDVNLADGEH